MGRRIVVAVAVICCALITACSRPDAPAPATIVSSPASVATAALLPDPLLGTPEMARALRDSIADEIDLAKEDSKTLSAAKRDAFTTGEPIPLRNPSVTTTPTTLGGYFDGKAPYAYRVPLVWKTEVVREVFLGAKNGKLEWSGSSEGDSGRAQLLAAGEALRRDLGPDAVIQYVGGMMGEGVVVGWSSRGEGLVFAYFY